MDILSTIKLPPLKEGELELINSYTRRFLMKNEVYVFSVVLCNNEIDKDFEQFTIRSLNILAQLFVGKTGIFNNNLKGNNSIARIISCKVEKVEGEKNCIGEDLYRLIARAFIPVTIQNINIIQAIENGEINNVNVGCSVRNTVCSICGKSINLCSHQKGKYYAERIGHSASLCYGKLTDPTDAYEFSFVAKPNINKERDIDMRDSKNSENTIKNIKDKNTNANVHKVPMVSMDTIGLAHKIFSKFGNNAEAINAVNDLIDMMYVKDDALVINGAIIDELIAVGNNSEQNDCCENCKTYVENTKYVSLFGYPDVEKLNKVIDSFEEQFEESPYLVMNSDTLNIFEKCTRKATCLDVENDDVDCEDYDECEGCPYESDEEGTVFIDHDCETGTISAYYFHNDDDYSIVIDNDLAFGVVKVR